MSTEEEWNKASEKIKTLDGAWLSRVLYNLDDAGLRLWSPGLAEFMKLSWSSDPETDMPVEAIYYTSCWSVELASVDPGDITTLGEAIVVKGYELIPMVPEKNEGKYYVPLPLPDLLRYEG